jgi:hypothetical protein
LPQLSHQQLGQEAPLRGIRAPEEGLKRLVLPLVRSGASLESEGVERVVDVPDRQGGALRRRIREGVLNHPPSDPYPALGQAAREIVAHELDLPAPGDP